MNVLLVEDDTITRGLLSEFLIDQGFEVRVAGSLTEAVLPSTFKPDVILSGWYLGTSTPEPLIQKAGAPVIIMSAVNDDAYEAVKKKALQAGAVTFIRKPFNNLNEFVHQLHAVANEGCSHEQRSGQPA